MYNYSQALTFTFFLPGPLTLVEEPGTLAWESLFQMKIYRWIKMKTQVSAGMLLCAPKSKLWASEWQSHVLSCPMTVPGQLKIQSTWLVSISDTFFWGSDIISRTTRWLLVNTGTTFNLLLPLLLVLLGLGLGQNSPFPWYVAKN